MGKPAGGIGLGEKMENLVLAMRDGKFPGGGVGWAETIPGYGAGGAQPGNENVAVVAT